MNIIHWFTVGINLRLIREPGLAFTPKAGIEEEWWNSFDLKKLEGYKNSIAFVADFTTKIRSLLPCISAGVKKKP